LALESDYRVFTEGFCHCFALELACAFAKAHRPIEFVYIPSRIHDGVAEHVLIRSGGALFDAILGAQREEEVVSRWLPKTAGRLEKVGHPGWLLRPVDALAIHTYLALRIEQPYFEMARDRARRFIDSNRDAYQLPLKPV